jgi:hypothetical protein
MTACICDYTHNYIHCIIDLVQRGWHTLRLHALVQKTKLLTYLPKTYLLQANLNLHIQCLVSFYLEKYRKNRQTDCNLMVHLAMELIRPVIFIPSLSFGNSSFRTVHSNTTKTVTRGVKSYTVSWSLLPPGRWKWQFNLFAPFGVNLNLLKIFAI